VGKVRLGKGRAAMTGASTLLPDNPVISVSAGPRFNGQGTTYDLDIGLEQTFEVAGERGLRMAAAKKFSSRLAAQFNETKWAVHRRVHRAFRMAQVARERLAMARRLLGFSKQLLSIGKRREAAGAISGLEVQVLNGEVAQSRQTELAFANAYRAARLTLAEVSGWPANHPPIPSEWQPVLREAPTVAQLLKLAQASHPAVATQLAAVAEAQANADLAEGEGAPKPSVGVSYAREGEAGGAAINVILGTLSMPIPIWQRNQGERARARSEVAVARAEYDALQRTFRIRLLRAHAAVSAALKQIAAYDKEVIPSFDRSLKMLERAFEAGKIGALEVMVARGRFLEIRSQSFNAYDGYYKALATLESVVGTDVFPNDAARSSK
jgi:cobalt-zinc-cadmium efflux system outer membrane protein